MARMHGQEDQMSAQGLMGGSAEKLSGAHAHMGYEEGLQNSYRGAPQEAPTVLGRELEVTMKVTSNLTEAIVALASLLQPFLDPAERPSQKAVERQPMPPVSPMASQIGNHRRELEELVGVVNDLCARIER